MDCQGHESKDAILIWFSKLNFLWNLGFDSEEGWGTWTIRKEGSMDRTEYRDATASENDQICPDLGQICPDVKGFLSCKLGNLWISFLKMCSQIRQKLVESISDQISDFQDNFSSIAKSA